MAYGRYQDAPTLVEMIRKDYTIAVHNATAALKSAEYNRDQTQAQVDKVRSGALARYGITEPEASPPSARLEDQQVVVDAAMAALKTVSENAGTKRDAGLAALEMLRPGVTTGENVRARTGHRRTHETVSRHGYQGRPLDVRGASDPTRVCEGAVLPSALQRTGR